MQTQTATTTVAANTSKASFVDHLMNDLAAHPFWIDLEAKAKAMWEANAKKKSHFEKIVEKKEGGNFYANPTFFKMKEGWNFRNLNSPKFIAGIKVLGAQIAAEGMKMPVKAFNEGNDPTFWLEDGHRRTIGLAYAVVHLDYAPTDLLIPFRMGDKFANDVDRKFSQIRDNSSLNPTPFEAARIYASMVAMGAKKEDLAKWGGISKSNVIRLLDMATVPVALQNYAERDIEIADTFVHKLYEKTNKNADIAIAALETAIQTAKDQGYDRVMPKHLPADVLAMYNGEKATKGKKGEQTPAPTPAQTPAPVLQNDATPPQTEQAAPEQKVDGANEGQDNNPPQATQPQGDAQPEQKATGSTTPDAPSPAAKDDAQKGSGELPVQSAHIPPAKDNLKFRTVVTEFFKHYVQFNPIDPEKPNAKRKIVLKIDEMDPELSFAILHNLNLD